MKSTVALGIFFGIVVDTGALGISRTEKQDDEYSHSKLPIIASKISQTGIAVGIGPQFMQKETTKLLDSIEKFVKAIQKRGI